MYVLYGLLNIIHCLSSDMWVVQPRSQPIYRISLGAKSVIPNTSCQPYDSSYEEYTIVARLDFTLANEHHSPETLRPSSVLRERLSWLKESAHA